jgi:hypothetical protein
MPFTVRVLFPGSRPPVRGYLYEDGLADAFGSEEGAIDYLSDVLEGHPGLLAPADFAIAVVRGNKGARIAELFGYEDIEEWPRNLVEHYWMFKNGIYRPEEDSREKTEDVERLLALEKKYRRTTISLRQYLSKPPRLGDLEPLIDVRVR